MNLSVRQMRTFLQVARIGNFTRAAETAHMTQAGLSTLIREKERQLDVRLFDRTTRMVALTAAGRRLLPVVERVVAELDDITAQLGAEGQASRQTLRLAATPLVSSNLLPEVFGRFRETHPGVKLRLFDADLRDVQSMVEAGEADMGLGFFLRRRRASSACRSRASSSCGSWLRACSMEAARNGRARPTFRGRRCAAKS